MKVKILQFLTTFSQLTARLENLLRGWLLILSLKEGLVECATACVKSEVILLQIEEAAKVIITFNSMTMSDKILDTLCRTLCDDQQTNPKKIPTEKSIIIL